MHQFYQINAVRGDGNPERTPCHRRQRWIPQSTATLTASPAELASPETTPLGGASTRTFTCQALAMSRWSSSDDDRCCFLHLEGRHIQEPPHVYLRRHRGRIAAALVSRFALRRMRAQGFHCVHSAPAGLFQPGAMYSRRYPTGFQRSPLWSNLHFCLCRVGTAAAVFIGWGPGAYPATHTAFPAAVGFQPLEDFAIEQCHNLGVVLTTEANGLEFHIPPDQKIEDSLSTLQTREVLDSLVRLISVTYNTMRRSEAHNLQKFHGSREAD